MSTYQYDNPYIAPDVQQQPPKPKRSKGILAGIAVAVALGGGIAVGTQLGTPETVTQTREVTPQACLDAISDARDFAMISADVVGASSDIMGTIPDLITAIATGDSVMLDQITGIVQDSNAMIEHASDRLALNEFKENAATCEGTGA